MLNESFSSSKMPVLPQAHCGPACSAYKLSLRILHQRPAPLGLKLLQVWVLLENLSLINPARSLRSCSPSSLSSLSPRLERKEAVLDEPSFRSLSSILGDPWYHWAVASACPFSVLQHLWSQGQSYKCCFLFPAVLEFSFQYFRKK